MTYDEEEEGVMVSLAGQVVQYGYDEDDDDTSGSKDEGYSIMLLVDGDEEYVVEPDRKGEKLEECMDRWVAVEGELFEKEDINLLVVHEFELDDEGPSYDEDW